VRRVAALLLVATCFSCFQSTGESVRALAIAHVKALHAREAGGSASGVEFFAEPFDQTGEHHGRIRAGWRPAATGAGEERAFTLEVMRDGGRWTIAGP
jgi:hypothetical protein